MKKIGFVLCLFLTLSGCVKKESSKVKEYNEKYENYMELLIDNSKQVTSNLPFVWKFNMYETEGKYGYDVAISSPSVAMYNIQMIVVDIEDISENKIAPSIGIFEENDYNMIPSQINTKKGFYEGIGVNGTTSKSSFILNCLVVYKDKNQVDNYAYFIVNANIDDFKEEKSK